MLDQDSFRKMRRLCEGVCPFFLEKSYVDDPEDCAEAEANGFYIDAYGDHRSYKRYELNDNKG